MRSTIQLVSARDCLTLRPVLQPSIEAKTRAVVGKRTAGLDWSLVAERARELLEDQPLTFADLGSRLAPDFAGYLPADLANVSRAMLALVQLPPRGVWGKSMAATHTTATAWLGQPLAERSEPDELILRYLTAFGPATAADISTWSGLTGLQRVLRRLRPDLRTFTNQRGQELFDVPEGQLPVPDLPVPVRIVAEFDNLVLAHADRSRIFDDANRDRFMTSNGLIRSSFLVDGFVHGSCTLNRGKSGVTLSFDCFRPLRRQDEAALRVQAERLLRFVAANAGSTAIVINQPG